MDINFTLPHFHQGSDPSSLAASTLKYQLYNNNHTAYRKGLSISSVSMSEKYFFSNSEYSLNSKNFNLSGTVLNVLMKLQLLIMRQQRFYHFRCKFRKYSLKQLHTITVVQLEIKHKTLECITINFKSVFLFLFSYDFLSVLSQEISIFKGQPAEHTLT